MSADCVSSADNRAKEKATAKSIADGELKIVFMDCF
jgi:hypothetical protein